MVLLTIRNLCLAIECPVLIVCQRKVLHLLLLQGNLGLLGSLLFVHLVNAGGGIKHLRWHGEGLAHLFEKFCGFLHCYIRGEICILESQLVIDPGWELLHVVSALVALIGEDHQPIVILGSQDSAHALRGLTHGIECEEVCIADLVVFLEEEHAGAQVS